MEHIPEILKALNLYGISPVMIIFMVMLYMFGVQSGAFPKFWKRAEEPTEIVPKWAEHLLQHFNHDTTSHHEATHDKLDQLIKMERDEHLQQQNMRDDVRDMKNTLNNFKEYGVKTR